MTPETLADELVKLNVTELIDLKRVLKEKYGLEETVPVIAAAAEEVAEVKEEKTSFTVQLVKVSEVLAERLNAVKTVNRILNVGLKAAMDLIKEPPVILGENIKATEAEEIRAEFAALNAEVVLV